MATKQTFKGILQFHNQTALEGAMELVDSEAPGSDLIDLQDSFVAEGLMVFNLDINASTDAWDENTDAFLILAENASRGFIVGVFNGGDPEFFNAAGDHEVSTPDAGEKLPVSEDYFPFEEGVALTYKGVFGSKKTSITMKTQKMTVNNREYFVLVDSSANLPGFNDYWDGTYFQKDNANVYSILATHEAGLNSLDFEGDQYSRQLAYNNNAKEGQAFAVISKDNETFRILTVEGFQDLDLPYGKCENCMAVRIDRYQINGEDSTKTTQRQYFAKGLGLVKVQFEKGSIELESVQS